MASTNSNINIIFPFLMGIVECFDLAGFFNDLTLPVSMEVNPLIKD